MAVAPGAPLPFPGRRPGGRGGDRRVKPPETAPEESSGSSEFTLLPLGLGWEGSIFNGEAGERFAWLLLIGLTYRLAFGRNDAGEYHVESGINGALDMYGRGYGYRNEPKKTRAVLRARMAGVTVARSGSKKTVRRSSGTRSSSRPSGERRSSGTRRSSSTASGERKAAGSRSSSTAQTELEKKRAAKRGRDKAEARSGLQNLGYTRVQANQLLASVGEQSSAEDYLKAALAAQNRRLKNDATG